MGPPKGKKEFKDYINGITDLTDKQKMELINELPQEIIYSPYVYQRKPNQMIVLYLKFRKRLDELIKIKQLENKKNG